MLYGVHWCNGLIAEKLRYRLLQASYIEHIAYTVCSRKLSLLFSAGGQLSYPEPAQASVRPRNTWWGWREGKGWEESL